MFGRKLKLFKLSGFEVSVDLSWIIIAILVTWSLAQSVFPMYDGGLSAATYWILGLIGAFGLFGSVIVHEFAHSIVARRFGLPMNGITLFIFGGVAEMNDEPPSPKAEFFMAIAGPLASIGIGALFFVLLGTGRSAEWSSPPLIIFSYLGTINIVLAIFNMLPAFPLDGGRVFRSLLWMWKGNILWATRIASGVGSGFGWFLIFAGLFFVFAGGIIGGIWWTLIGLFLRGASKTSLQTLMVRSALEKESVKRFMKKDIVSVPPEVTLDHLVEDYIYKYHYKMYPVMDEHTLLSYVTIGDVKSVPRSEWARHTVAEFAHPYSTDTTVLLDEDALKALLVMNKTGNNRLMVVDNGGKLVGMVALRDLREYLSTKYDSDGGNWPQDQE